MDTKNMNVSEAIRALRNPQKFRDEVFDEILSIVDTRDTSVIDIAGIISSSPHTDQFTLRYKYKLNGKVVLGSVSSDSCESMFGPNNKERLKKVFVQIADQITTQLCEEMVCSGSLNTVLGVESPYAKR